MATVGGASYVVEAAYSWDHLAPRAPGVLDERGSSGPGGRGTWLESLLEIRTSRGGGGRARGEASAVACCASVAELFGEGRARRADARALSG